MGWQDWVRDGRDRAVALRGGLRAARASRSRCSCAPACRVFHFDVGDGHFVEPVTIGPVVLESIAPLVHEAGGVLDCHLMVDNPLRHFPQIAARAATASPSTTRSCDDVPATIAAAREHGLQVGVAFNPETRAGGRGRRSPADADLVLCMSIHPGYCGQKFMPEAIDRIGRLRAALPERVFVQVDGGIGDENIAPRIRRRRGAARRRLGDLRPRGPAARVPPPRTSPRVSHYERALELAERGRGKR